MGMSVASIPHVRTCIMDVNRTIPEDVAGDTHKYILFGPRKHDCDLMARTLYPERAIRNARPARVSCRMNPERARSGRRVGDVIGCSGLFRSVPARTGIRIVKDLI